METIVQKLENYYQKYLDLSSNVMLDLTTDSFFSKLESLPQCKQILEELKKNYTIADGEFHSLACTEIDKYKELFESHDANYYAAFCLQWYYFQKGQKRPNSMKTYVDKTRWLTLTNKESADKSRLFKTDVIRPIVDYIISQIKEQNLIYYYLTRFKNRVERYTFNSLAEKNELGIQKDLALYLFDQGLSFYHEPNLGNGRPDFVIDLECNDKPFVIEIKKIKKLSKIVIDSSLRQLKAYLANSLLVAAYTFSQMMSTMPIIRKMLTIIYLFYVSILAESYPANYNFRAISQLIYQYFFMAYHRRSLDELKSVASNYTTLIVHSHGDTPWNVRRRGISSDKSRKNMKKC